jgi:nitrile hydratase
MKPDRGSYRPLSYFQLMEVSLRELLVEKGIVTEEQVNATVEDMRSRTPERGAKVVARAWLDPAFKARLLQNGTKACEELGLDVPALKLLVVENTPQVHNAIVCTLCSCYPRMLLGIPPEWYKSRNYRSRMVREPRAVLAEFGLVLPEKVQIRVHDSTADMRYIVLPMRPAGTEGWSEERLAALVNRDCMIGVAVPKGPNESPKQEAGKRGI